MTEPSPRAEVLPRNVMILLSLVQGLVLLFLWRAGTEQTWPATVPVVNFPLWTITLVGPTLLLFCLERGNAARLAMPVGLVTALLTLLAVYVGWQASPHGAFPVGSLVFTAAVALLVGCYKALMYLQPFARRRPWTYDILFVWSWRNFMVGALSAALAIAVGAILYLWATLFRVIGIEFFSNLFSEDWFLFPVLSLAFGLGVFIFRSLLHLIDRITEILEGLMRLLLPLVLTVAALFLGTLPFTGLAPLWNTGHGTGLLLALNAIALFFVNGVYQTGAHTPYPPIIHRLLAPGIALLPVVSALALFGMYLRVDQHGWTVERCWGTAVAVLLAMFSVGYAWGVLRRRSLWPLSLARTNTVLGWVVAGLMLAANSPLLDFRRISTASQFARVEAGTLELREFDFYYARRHLARPAHLKLETLAQSLEDSDPELAQSIRNPKRFGDETARASRVFWERVVYRPEPFEVPEALRPMVETSIWASTILDSGYVIVLVRVDLNDDGDTEYVVIADDGEGYRTGNVFYRDGEEWRSGSLRARGPEPGQSAAEPDLRTDPIGTADSPFPDLTIGELTFGVNP